MKFWTREDCIAEVIEDARLDDLSEYVFPEYWERLQDMTIDQLENGEFDWEVENYIDHKKIARVIGQFESLGVMWDRIPRMMRKGYTPQAGADETEEAADLFVEERCDPESGYYAFG